MLVSEQCKKRVGVGLTDWYDMRVYSSMQLTTSSHRSEAERKRLGQKIIQTALTVLIL